ncbi:hypothetical protein FRB96_008908 [Tulasnella sp. 330]|nr:hypothetical protein FRB96_008908 [Tulasnella sp. 330]KAG8883199.1 hypothetical protein FRB97_007021 [Tulasnella sp. 331]KAG8888520.1 hypothetical protein FRB98_007485 [Tulasnella sp. 332]
MEDGRFPPLTRSTVLAFQCSSWYAAFAPITVKSTIVRPLPEEFRQYLESDGVTIPAGAEDTFVAQSSLSNSESDTSDTESDIPPQRTFSFPDLDATIRKTIVKYEGAVFPKLNWTAPKDASWILAPSTPLKCTSPADVYLYLKSSDFAAHDLDHEMVFDGCVDNLEAQNAGEGSDHGYQLELVLKKWYALDQSREMRCFVRDDILLAICQRDSNFYEFLNGAETQETIRSGISSLWRDKIKGVFSGGSNYVVDVLLTRSLESAHIIDFNPYAPRTDALLFDYQELQAMYNTASQDPSHHHPEVRVITSASHPRASRNAPIHQHNMVPREALELSQGRDVEGFRESWVEGIKKAMEAEPSSNTPL